jgi:hypothetical protein
MLICQEREGWDSNVYFQLKNLQNDCYCKTILNKIREGKENSYSMIMKNYHPIQVVHLCGMFLPRDRASSEKTNDFKNS